MYELDRRATRWKDTGTTKKRTNYHRESSRAEEGPERGQVGKRWVAERGVVNVRQVNGQGVSFGSL